MGTLLVNLGRLLLASGVSYFAGMMVEGDQINNIEGDYQEAPDEPSLTSPKGVYLLVGLSVVITSAVAYFICRKAR